MNVDIFGNYYELGKRKRSFNMSIIYKLLGAWILYSIHDNLDVWNKISGLHLKLDKTLIKKLEKK